MTRLDWDSDFFKINIAEIISSNNKVEITEDINAFDLIILKQKIEENVHLENFENSFTETKYIFSKKLKTSSKKEYNLTILDTDTQTLKAKEFYKLAFESGKYSRFKLDSHFCKKRFKKLYKKWVKNSINKTFADKVFYIKNQDTISAFVTLKINKEHANIGLIAVSKKEQGKGFGSILLTYAENYCISQNIFELKIPTQKKNSAACNFYLKNKYRVQEETIIKHYWNNKYDTI